MRMIRADTGFSGWRALRDLIARSFAYMEPHLGHPARAVLSTEAELADEAANGSVFVMIDGGAPVGCLFCRPSHDRADALYIGKLAVAASQRGKGLARALVDAAARQARRQGFTALTLDTGDAFDDLHRAFQKLGFGPPEPRPGEPGVVSMVRLIPPVSPPPTG